jgi:hypothetical protein
MVAMRTVTLPSGASRASLVYAGRGVPAVLVPGAFVAGLFLLGAAVGGSRGNWRDVTTGLVGGLLAAGVFTGIGALVARQRLVVDGRLIWIRVVRWRGPIDLDDVVAVRLFATRGGPALILVQPTAGTPVGLYSAIATFGMVRPGRYRNGVHSGRMRYVALPSWMLRPEVLRMVAPPLLRRSDLFVDRRARRMLTKAVSRDSR